MLKKIQNIINEQPIYLLTAALTIFVTAFYGYSNDIYYFFSHALLLFYLVYPKITERPFFWLLMISLFLPIIYYGWAFVGNQKFIHLYLLCFLFLGSIYKQYQEKILYLGSTYLIFLIFFAASIWKFSLSDFRSGNFLEYTFLSGHIFDLYAVILESLSFSSEKWQEVYGSILMPNRENINILQNNVEGGSITLLSSERIVMASKILTILSLVTQATISLSLLLYMVTKKRVFAYIMHSFICEFIIFAYYPTQVLGFGMLLCILGIAHSHFTVPKFKIIYLGLILLLLLYDLPLSGWLMNNDIPYITMF